MNYPWTVSISDVQKHPNYHENLTQEQLDKILHSLGMNISLGYQDDMRWAQPVDEKEAPFGYFHKSQFTDEVCIGPRYVGVSRSDGPWRKFVDKFLGLPLV